MDFHLLFRQHCFSLLSSNNSIMKKFFALITVCCFGAIIIFSSGCKEKGCTNPAAINFNSVADEDDGTCILCNEAVDTLAILSKDLIDFNSSGPHYNTVVATFYVAQLRKKYSYSECGSNNCYIVISIQNHVNETMTINYNIQGSGNVSFSRSNVIAIPGNSKVQSDNIASINISNPCGFFSTSSLFVQTFGNIIYN